MTETVSGMDRLLAKLEGELGRRLVHASGAGLPGLYLIGLPWWVVQGAVLLLVTAVAILEFLRLRVGLNWWVYEHLTREYEQDSVAGYALYAVSMAVVALAFAPMIAVPAMLMLAIADPVGGFLAGDDPIPVKRPMALFGTFIVSVGLAVPFMPLIAAAGAAGAVTIADGMFLQVRGYVIDDNLSIPIVAAVVSWIIIAIL